MVSQPTGLPTPSTPGTRLPEAQGAILVARINPGLGYLVT